MLKYVQRVRRVNYTYSYRDNSVNQQFLEKWQEL